MEPMEALPPCPYLLVAPFEEPVARAPAGMGAAYRHAMHIAGVVIVTDTVPEARVAPLQGQRRNGFVPRLDQVELAPLGVTGNQ